MLPFAGAGFASLASAALGTAGLRNRKGIRNSMSNIPTTSDQQSALHDPLRSYFQDKPQQTLL
jgi:hypothetical protein